MQRAVAVILVIKQDEFDFERRMERVLHSDFLRDERPHGGRENGDPGIGLKQGDDRVVKVTVGECALRLPRSPVEQALLFTGECRIMAIWADH